MKIVKPIVLTDAMLVSTSATEVHAEWAIGTAYALNDYAIRAATHRIYQCIQGPSTGNTPESSPLYWTDKGPANQWAMFDTKISTQTTATTSLAVVLKPGLCNSLCLFGLVGTTLTVTVRDGVAGPVIYTKTVTLDGTIVTDWYQYYFEPFVQMPSVVLTDLPPYGDAHISVTVTGIGTVKCGMLLVGTFYQLGQAEYGATSGITDYSRKTTDTFGNFTFEERAYSDRISLSLMVPNAQLNKVKSVLASTRGPCVWIGSDASGLEVLNTMGFYRDFSLVVSYPTTSLCSIDIEGLT